MKHPLASGGLIMVGGNMVVNVVNYVYHLIMGRVLGPVDYGVLASLYSLLYLVAVVPGSASVAIVKFISGAKDVNEAASVYIAIKRFIFKLAIAASVVLVLLSPAVAGFLRIDDLKSVVCVSFVLFLSLVTLVNQATSQGLLKFMGVVGPNMVSAVLKLTVGLGLVLLGWSVFGAMAGVVVASVFAYFYSTRFIGKIVQKRKSGEFNLKPFFDYALPVLIQALAFTSLYTTDVILVKHFFSPYEAGIYAALSTLGKIIFFASSPISATMFPIISGRKSRGEPYRKVFFASLAITLLFSAVIVLFYWLFPGIAIGTLYGKAYLAAKSDLVWMGIFILFYTLSFLLVNFSLSLDRTKIIYLPLAAALAQVSAIWFFHGSLLQVIQISLAIAASLFFVSVAYLGYDILRELKHAVSLQRRMTYQRSIHLRRLWRSVLECCYNRLAKLYAKNK